MQQNELYPVPGSQKNRKRVGRGNGSGHGTYSGRGAKGQKSRSGVQILRGFEGGQLPIIKRLPRKRGFHNMFRVEYSPVNLDSLNLFEAGTEITPEVLLKAGLVESLKRPVKILAEGEIKNALTVKANKFSEAAKAKIEAAGGKVEVI
jgi:large subunit ribosomal protein L15